jgi:hypothetical protein
MRSYLIIALLLTIPLTAHADGIRIAEYTIGSIPYVLLAKLIMVDQVKHLAKIKIIKRLGIVDGEMSVDPEIEIKLKTPAKMNDGKWIKDDRYWDSTTKLEAGKNYFFMNYRSKFEVAEYSKDKEKKFELFFDKDKYHKTLSEASEKTLRGMLADRDLQADALRELLNRKLLSAKFVFSISDPDQFRRIMDFYYKTLPAN